MSPISPGHPRNRSLASLVSDSMVLWHLMRGQRDDDNRTNHAQRLEEFYAPQAAHYDDFRERLLHGRQELVERLAPLPGSTVVELGGGTGRNLEYFGARMLSLNRVDVVDLCPSLLSQARKRCERWPDVARAVQADAADYKPGRVVDCVFFSYSLTMIPDWRRALANAVRMLRPGGLLGAVDFYISPHHAAPGSVQHGTLARHFWPRWFAHDGVHLSSNHLPALQDYTDRVYCEERMATLPYLPWLRVPYYLYVGRKRAPYPAG